MSNFLSNAAPRASFFSLDQSLRRNVFRFLRDDYMAAAVLAEAYPRFEHEIGACVFQTYRATGCFHLFGFLSALFDVPALAPYVETIILDSEFDEGPYSGFYGWLLFLAEEVLPPGHWLVPMQQYAFQFEQYCEEKGAFLAEGFVHGTEDWPPEVHNLPLLVLLPALCPNVVEVEMPAEWGEEAEQEAWNNFPSVEEVRMA